MQALNLFYEQWNFFSFYSQDIRVPVLLTQSFLALERGSYKTKRTKNITLMLELRIDSKDSI